MATVKNFGLAGVAANVQFKKAGGKIDWDDTKFSVTDKDGTAVALSVALVPSNDADAASKQYVDSVATGLDVKNSVRVVTTTDLDTAVGGNAIYTAGTVEGQGTWTGLGAALVIDGVSVLSGDRVLVKDEAGTDREGNGIWVYDGADEFARASDADNTPNNEVSGGMFTFAEEGTQADTGWVMNSPNGIAVVDSATADNLLFTQFSGSGAFTGGDGIDITAAVISHDTSGTADTAVTTADVLTHFSGGASGSLERRSWANILTDLDILTDAAGGNPLTASDGIDLTGNALTLDIAGLGTEAIATGDTMVFDNASAAGTNTSRTVALFLDDRDIIHDLASTGLVTVTDSTTGAQVYAARTLIESTTARQEGAQVNNGNGVSGNPEIGIDINNLTDNATNMVAADQFIVDNGTNNRSITGTEIANGVSTLLSLDSTRIDAGDTFTFVDTDATVDSVTIGVEDFATTGSLAIAEFKHGAAADDCGFVFTNEAGGVRVETQGATNCDIRLVPAGTGSVLIGDAGAATIQGDDDTVLTVKGGDAVAGAAGDLILEGGDGSGGFADGDVLIRPGTGGTGIPEVCIQDEDSENIACFKGTAGTDVNYLLFTSATTGVGPTIEPTGESNIDLNINASGTGQLVLDGTTWPDDGVALDSILATNTANVLTAVTSADDADRVLQHTSGGNIEWVLVSSVGGNSFESWVTDSGTIVADSTSDTATLTGGDGIVTNGNASTDTITIDVDLTEFATDTTISISADFLVFDDTGVGNKKITPQNFFDSLDVPNTITVDGFVVRTAADTYASRTITESAAAGFEGIDVVNGDGVAGNPTVGVDIASLTADSSVLGTDQLIAFNGTNNVRVLVSDLVAGGTLSFGTWATDTGGPLVADSANDTATLTGGLGIATTGDAGSDTVTFDMDIDTNLTQVGEDLATADEFAFFNASGAAGNVGSMTGQEIADGVATILSIDTTRITDASNTFVDTDLVAGQVTINTENGTGGSGTQRLATFLAAAGSSTVTDANFLFQNEDAVDTGGNDELQICAAGAETDIDIRLCPKGAGEVILGDAAANATLSASDGTTGFDLTLNGGDGSAGDGGDIILTPGTGTGTDGKVCITDDDSVNVTCFEGVETAVNNLVITNAATGGGPLVEAEGSDTNIDIEFLPKGTGVLSIDSTYGAATVYRDNLTDNSNDIPNTAYVAEQVAASVASGTFVLFDTLDDDGLVTGTNSIPLNADITRVVVEVTSVYAGSQGFDIGTVAGPTRVTDDSADGFVDWQSTGIYIIENHELASLAASLFLLTVSAASAGTGAGTIRVEFALAT